MLQRECPARPSKVVLPGSARTVNLLAIDAHAAADDVPRSVRRAEPLVQRLKVEVAGSNPGASRSPLSATRSDELRLTGSGGSNRVMEAEFKRLLMRSPFEVRVERPRREGDATLLYPFDARMGWVAGCYHRTASRVSWDLWSSPAVRLEPLFADLLPAFSSDDRLPRSGRLRLSVEVGAASDFEASPLQLRGVVKNAIVEGLASRGVAAALDAEAPDIVFVVRRAGVEGRRRTVVGIDIGLGARHRRGARVAMGPAAMRETMAAQLIMLSRWDARTEPLVDPMAGGCTIPIEAARLAVGAPVRKPADLPLGHIPAFRDLPREAPDLFPGTIPVPLQLNVWPVLSGNIRAGWGGSNGMPSGDTASWKTPLSFCSQV